MGAGVLPVRRNALPLLILLALLAGCTTPTPQPVFPATAASGHAVPVTQVPGVEVVATLSGGGPTLHIHGEARNVGEATYQVPSLCTDGNRTPTGSTQPWSVAARWPGDTAPDATFAIYPQRGCSQVLTASFRPGQTSVLDLDWDGTFFSTYLNGTTGLLAHSYAVDVVLEVYAGSADHPYPFVVTLPVEILDHGQ